SLVAPARACQRPERAQVILTKLCPSSFVGTAEALFSLVEPLLSFLAVATAHQVRRLDGDRQRPVSLSEFPQPSRVDGKEKQQGQRRGEKHEWPPNNSQRLDIETEQQVMVKPRAFEEGN